MLKNMGRIQKYEINERFLLVVLIAVFMAAAVAIYLFFDYRIQKLEEGGKANREMMTKE